MTVGRMALGWDTPKGVVVIVVVVVVVMAVEGGVAVVVVAVVVVEGGVGKETYKQSRRSTP